MKKQLSSIDLHFILKELEILKDSRIDKIYQPEKNLLVFSFYKANSGKKILKITVGKSLFLAEGKEDYEETLGFGMLLRKHIDGFFLCDSVQIEPERIIKLSFKSKDVKKNLYIEFFGKGNAILCDENGLIINALEHHEFKDRTIYPKIIYKHPAMKYNLFDLNKSSISELLKNSAKGSIITSLATELGLGGIYSEEVCLLANIEKDKNPKSINDKESGLILSSIKQIINKKSTPQVILENDNPVDFTPFDLEFYKNHKKRKFQTFNEALEFFYSHYREIKETEFDKKLKSLCRIIEEQKTAIDDLRKEEIESREKGELIYHKYGIVREILDEINKASKKCSWKEIKEKLKEHKIVKEVNEKDRKIVVEI